jgi:hypothetical protein
MIAIHKGNTQMQLSSIHTANLIQFACHLEEFTLQIIWAVERVLRSGE